MKKIIKVINTIIYIPFVITIMSVFIIFIFVFFYSKNTELDRMTNQEITNYFYKNKKNLKKIIDFCEEYPTLQRVNEFTFKLYEQNISKEVNKAVLDIQKIITSIKVDAVECSRLKKVLNNDLLGVSFWLYSAGLGVSGEGQLLEYETIRNKEYWKGKKRIDIPWQTKLLIEDDWSIVYIK